jgi:hypothetical protein
MTLLTSTRPLSRRRALGLLGGSLGTAAVLGASSGFLAPVFAATTPTLTTSLDKPLYEAGQLMTLTVTENVSKAEGRTVVLTDSTATAWKKTKDDGTTLVFTATSGANRAGANTVTAKLTRTSDGVVVSSAASYSLGAQWKRRFPGDRQDRVMVGMAVTDNLNSNLQWDQAVTLLGTAGPFASVRRCFVPSWITKANIDKWADWAESKGVYPVISFKVPGNDWAGLAAGTYDSDLDVLCATLDARAVAKRAPVCVAVHHEPSGDGDLAVWARMQEYLSNRFAPWKDVFCFTTISNGYDWGPYRGGQGEVATTYPASLVAALNRNGHILACDTYDSADPTKLDYAQYDRTSLKIAGFVAWARAQGVQRIGLGEFGCHDAIDLSKCWSLINDNRDLFGFACYFNSGQNSRADWRMIPTTYAPDPAVTSYTDAGGSIASANRLGVGKQMFTATVTA